MSREQQTAGDTIDLRAIFGKMTAMWWLFLITIGLCTAGAVWKYKTTTKSYLVGASIMLSEKSRNSFGASNEEFIKGTGYLRNSADIEDQIAVLRSQNILQKTLKRLPFGISYLAKKNYLTSELYDYPPFQVKLDSSVHQYTGLPIHIKVNSAAKTYTVNAEGKNVHLYDPVKGVVTDAFDPLASVKEERKFGEPVKLPHLAFTISFPDSFPYDPKTDYFFFINSLTGLVDSYGAKLGIESMGEKSNIVMLSTSGEAVEKEKDFLNTLMAVYIESEQDKQNEKGNRTIEFIDSQLKRSRAEMQAATDIVIQSGPVGGDGRAEQLYNEMARYQEQQSRARTGIQYLQEQLINGMSADDDRTVPSSANLGDPGLESLIDRYNQNVNRLSQIRVTEKTPTAPTLALMKTIRDGRAQIIGSAKNLLSKLQIELQDANQRIGQANWQLGQLPKEQQRKDIAINQYELTESINNYLMEKLYEAQIAINSDQVDKTVVDPARMIGGGPVAPDKKTIFGAALLLGLILPIGFILLRDFFNDTIADQDELKRLSPIPLLATIPSSKRKRITMDEPKSLLAEAFRTARINLQYLNADAPRQVVGFTSSSSGEGKTFCALNLATVMALSGKRAVLVDADMRRPRVQETLELKDGPGLSNILIGDAALDSVIRRTDIPGLDVITAGPIPPNPLELVESPHMEEFFKQLRARYDHVIIDASPMGLVSEFVILMRHIDVTLYVVRERHTHRRDLRLVNGLHANGKLGRIDLLLNDVAKGNSSGYGYYVK
ncbi:MAG: polysaccharide biosynthesis tyrosine autokinase [Flavobacteriales bacterium]|nr:polysaccharide biosynthesis tyrosine autokinase [Flavobacteriales bacterium]MBK9193988.1 polysaccharide biosynthesis tyrosine autokinase [Flavobacteriales bacterium]